VASVGPVGDEGLPEFSELLPNASVG
jgi:hypothetical protein